MTTLRDARSVSGSVHDIEALRALQSSDCNALFVSSRTLYLLANLAQLDINFKSRFASEFLPGGQYIVVDPAGSDGDLVDEIINNFRLEVYDMGCDLTAALNALTTAISLGGASGCGCTIGGGLDNEEGEEGGTVPSPVGDITYGPPDGGIANRQCKVANSIYFTYLDLFTELDNQNVDQMGIIGLSIAVATVAAIIGLVTFGPIGAAMAAVAGLIAAFSAQLIGVTVNLGDIVTELTSAEDDLICALFYATDAGEARTNWESVVSGLTLTAPEQLLINMLLTNSTLNVLWFSTDTSEAFYGSYTPPNACLCPDECEWEFSSGITGTGNLDRDGAERVLTSHLDGGVHRVHIEITEPAPCLTTNFQITDISSTGDFTGGSKNAKCRDSAGDDQSVYDNADPLPTGTFEASRVIFSSGVGAFTVTLTLEDTPDQGPCPTP